MVRQLVHGLATIDSEHDVHLEDMICVCFQTCLTLTYYDQM